MSKFDLKPNPKTEPVRIPINTEQIEQEAEVNEVISDNALASLQMLIDTPNISAEEIVNQTVLALKNEAVKLSETIKDPNELDELETDILKLLKRKLEIV